MQKEYIMSEMVKLQFDYEVNKKPLVRNGSIEINWTPLFCVFFYGLVKYRPTQLRSKYIKHVGKRSSIFSMTLHVLAYQMTNETLTEEDKGNMRLLFVIYNTISLSL